MIFQLEMPPLRFSRSYGGSNYPLFYTMRAGGATTFCVGKGKNGLVVVDKKIIIAFVRFLLTWIRICANLALLKRSKQMTGQVPSNQTVSFSTYVSAVSLGCIEVPWDFMRKHADRICRAFEMGEPISMMIEEINLRWEVARKHTPHKSPLQMARDWKARGVT